VLGSPTLIYLLTAQMLAVWRVSHRVPARYEKHHNIHHAHHVSQHETRHYKQAAASMQCIDAAARVERSRVLGGFRVE
jgi:hypothetical protein